MGANTPIPWKGEEKADSAFQKPCSEHQKPSVQWTKITKCHLCFIWKLKCQRWVTIADWLILILLSELGSHAHGTSVLHTYSVVRATGISVLHIVYSVPLGFMSYTWCAPCSWDFCSAHGVCSVHVGFLFFTVCTVLRGLLFSPFPREK